MRLIIVVGSVVSLLSACSSVAPLKQPNDRERVPINETIPAEVQRGTL